MISEKAKQAVIEAKELLDISRNVLAFTGAGISVASGIPSFRGESGIWSKYDPNILELSYYLASPEKCWKFIKEIFYDSLKGIKANAGHFALAEMEKRALLKSIFTQNIDNLHQQAGSLSVYEFHGNTRYFTCTHCMQKYDVKDISLEQVYPKCPKCSHLLKPDFIFFSEAIPLEVFEEAYSKAEKCDLLMVIGCSGQVYPANQIPYYAKEFGAKIIEINPQESAYSKSISDIFIQGESQEILPELLKQLKLKEEK